ncbi:MAG: GAF domain-containing protein [Terriglobales bacterium]
MFERNFNDSLRSDGAFTGPLDQETFRALLFNSFLRQQNRMRAGQREGERLAALAAARRAVAESGDLRAALNMVVTRALDTTGSTGAAIAIGAQGEMTCWAMSGPTAPPLGALVPLDSGLSGECVRSRRTLRCDDTENDPRVNREACARLGGVGSMLLVPLVRRNAAVGILEVFSTRPHAFDDTDEHVLGLLAVIASAALADFTGSEAAPRVSRNLATSVRPISSPISPV